MCDCIISGFLDAKSLFDIFNLSDGKIKYAGMDVLLELCYSGNCHWLISDLTHKNPKFRISGKIRDFRVSKTCFPKFSLNHPFPDF